MELQPGTRVGTLEILGPLGAGGMGEVHRARDTRLGREVAVKVLPRSTSRDPSRLARFDREARLLAALNHPGIGMIYGIEESAGDRLLVLELVPGPTLAERIAAGAPCRSAKRSRSASRSPRPWPTLTRAGSCTAISSPRTSSARPTAASRCSTSAWPRRSQQTGAGADQHTASFSDLETREHAVLGTPAYMSPEQARGREMDRRTDVWSFGCILYEMLTRKRAFQRATQTDTLVAVLEQDPDWSALPEATPPAIRTLLRRCLQRDRDRRLHDMADVRLELEESLGSDAQGPRAAAAARPRTSRPTGSSSDGRRTRRALRRRHNALLSRLVPPLAEFRAGFNEKFSSRFGPIFHALRLGSLGPGARGPAVGHRGGAPHALRTSAAKAVFATAGVFLAFSSLWTVPGRRGGDALGGAAEPRHEGLCGEPRSRRRCTSPQASRKQAVDLLDPEHRRDYPERRPRVVGRRRARVPDGRGVPRERRRSRRPGGSTH